MQQPAVQQNCHDVVVITDNIVEHEVKVTEVKINLKVSQLFLFYSAEKIFTFML